MPPTATDWSIRQATNNLRFTERLKIAECYTVLQLHTILFSNAYLKMRSNSFYEETVDRHRLYDDP